MSSDIVKEAVFDGRIIQSRPKYAVEKGALSITNAPFAAISQSASQHTYNIYVPSENVFVDRALEWSSTCFLKMTYTRNAGSGVVALNAKVLIPGRDVALCAFPLNALCSTMTTTINDTTSVINSQDVQREVLRLTDYKHNRIQRTCPTQLDTYLRNRDMSDTVKDTISGYQNATAVDYVPNGAWAGLTFTDPNGNAGAYAQLSVGGAGAGTPITIDTSLGVPTLTNASVGGSPAGQALPEDTSITLYARFRTTEKLVLSPFVFADTHECDTGLFGINNIQLIMNLRSPQQARVLRTDPGFNTTANPSPNLFELTNIEFNPAKAFENSYINTQFLTPSLETALPPKSVVPYMEFPRYITVDNPVLGAFGSTNSAEPYINTLASQTITLPQIPDLLIIYCKATQVSGEPNPQGVDYGDGYLPLDITGKSPLQVQFDNFSGLLSSHTAEQLYAMSVRNGLEMDYNQWSGRAYSPRSVLGTAPLPANTQLGYDQTSLTGGFLVLKPSQDITLQSGQAPSLVGNFTLQFNIRVRNTYPFKVKPQLFVITANSGFFESIRGSSRIIKGVLSEQDIISAPLASTATHSELKRVVGGKGLLSNLGNILSKARDVYHATKPAVSMLKEHLPAGKVKDAMSAVGYGSGGMSGGMSGGRSGGRKSIADRLM